MAVKIFCCYAHEDEPLLNKLKAQLRPLQRQGLIDMWHDRDINAGTEWEREISKQINEAQIILLLVSPDFMNSDYCFSVEMQRAIERHEREETCVIPVILRPIYWQGTLGKLQALPTNAKPIIDRFWHSTDEALYDVSEGIRKIIDKGDAKPAPFITNMAQDFRLDQQDFGIDQFAKFTPLARKVLSFSQKEALRTLCHYIGTEHLLLGLICEGEGVAVKVLSNLGIDLSNVRKEVEAIIDYGDRNVLSVSGLTPRAKKVIRLGLDEAHQMNNLYLDSEHLLLGLISEGEGVAGSLLIDNFGITLDKARAEIIRLHSQ